MKAYTVVAILEANPGQETTLKDALTAVIAPSRAEDTCLEYRLHQNIDNKHQFILYETWQSQEAHREQFNKSYILDLAKKIKDLLAKPYEVYFAHELHH